MEVSLEDVDDMRFGFALVAILAVAALFVVGISMVAFRQRGAYATGMNVREATAGWDAGLFHSRKTHGTKVRVDEETIDRDRGFFLVFFAVAVCHSVPRPHARSFS